MELVDECETGLVCTYVKPEPCDCSWYVAVPLRYEYPCELWFDTPRPCADMGTRWLFAGEYEWSGEDEDRLELLDGSWAVAGSVACARAGGESGGGEWWL